MAENRIPSYAMPLVGFRSRKAAQVCAYLAVKNSDGCIEKLKLIKLVYLTEREFVRQHRMPMLFDELYSLPHGPICSSTLNGIDGVTEDDAWNEHIARNGNVVVATKRFVRDDLDELSDAEVAYLDATWDELGHLSASQLRNYSHDHCPEYTETPKSRIPIAYSDVLRAFGEPDADDIDHEISSIRHAESMFA